MDLMEHLESQDKLGYLIVLDVTPPSHFHLGLKALELATKT